MVKINDVKKLLNEVEYKVVVEKLKEGCVVKYPNRIHAYTLTDSGFVFTDENSQTYLYNLNKNSIRVGIMVHIMRVCSDIDYHSKLIEFYIGNKRAKSVESILPLLGSEEDEQIICGIVQEVIKHGHREFWLVEAEDVGLKEECEAILDIWEDR